MGGRGSEPLKFKLCPKTVQTENEHVATDAYKHVKDGLWSISGNRSRRDRDRKPAGFGVCTAFKRAGGHNHWHPDKHGQRALRVLLAAAHTLHKQSWLNLGDPYTAKAAYVLSVRSRPSVSDVVSLMGQRLGWSGVVPSIAGFFKVMGNSMTRHIDHEHQSSHRGHHAAPT